MSVGSWNGRELPARADTVASRCLDIIERGMARMKLGRAPARFNQVLAVAEPGPRQEAEVAAPEPPKLTQEDVVAAFRAMPLSRRTVAQLAFDLGRSDETIRRMLKEAGEEIVSLEDVRAAKKADRVEEARGRVLAAWQDLPYAQRKVSSAARSAGVSEALASRILAEAGLKKGFGPGARCRA